MPKQKDKIRISQIDGAKKLRDHCKDALSTFEKSYDLKKGESGGGSLRGKLADKLDSFVKTEGGFRSKRTRRPYQSFQKRLKRLEHRYQASLQPMVEVKSPNATKS
jgi:hypothetical protein